jgi:hypothetical protein
VLVKKAGQKQRQNHVQRHSNQRIIKGITNRQPKLFVRGKHIDKVLEAGKHRGLHSIPIRKGSIERISHREKRKK